FVETAGTNGTTSAPSDIVRAASVIAPPTGLTATANRNGSVRLNWTASPSGTPYYWIYENGTRLAYPAHNTTTFTATALTSHTPRPFTATGLTSGTRYSFCVSAAGPENNESACTPSVTITATLAPPTNLKASVNGWGDVTLTWTRPFSGAFYMLYYKDLSAPN